MEILERSVWHERCSILGMESVPVVERALAGSSPQPSRPPGGARHGVRDRILEAALEEFAGKGFQEASLAAIARRVGVTAPLVLYHFGSKANLWREAVAVFCANWAAAVEGAAVDGRDLDGREALRLMIRRLVVFLAGNRAACRLLRDEGGIAAGQDEWLASKHLKPVLETIERVYRRAVDEGAVRPAPFETTFFQILGASSCWLESRTLAARLLGSGDERPGWIEDWSEQVVAFCFEGIAMPPKRPERSSMPTMRKPSRSVSPAAIDTKEVAL